MNDLETDHTRGILDMLTPAPQHLPIVPISMDGFGTKTEISKSEYWDDRIKNRKSSINDADILDSLSDLILSRLKAIIIVQENPHHQIHDITIISVGLRIAERPEGTAMYFDIYEVHYIAAGVTQNYHKLTFFY